jgi:hypothetical protein
VERWNRDSFCGPRLALIVVPKKRAMADSSAPRISGEYGPSAIQYCASPPWRIPQPRSSQERGFLLSGNRAALRHSSLGSGAAFRFSVRRANDQRRHMTSRSWRGKAVVIDGTASLNYVTLMTGLFLVSQSVTAPPSLFGGAFCWPSATIRCQN